MTLDILLLAIFLLLSYLGWRSGVTGQALRVVAAVSVILFTSPVSSLLRGILFPQKTVVEPLIEVGTMFLATIVIYVGISLAGWLIIKIMRRTSDTLSAMDHAGGAALGAIKAGLLVYVFGVLALLSQGPLEVVDKDDKLHLRDGHVTAFVARYNILAPWRFPDVMRLERAIRIADHAASKRRGAQQLREHGAAADFIRREAFQKLLERESLVKAARAENLPLILADEEARAFLNEDRNVEELRKVDWEDVEASIIGEPKAPDDGASDQAGDEAASSPKETSPTAGE
jgi:uncharacterized membrane protein required for colicin V production